MKGNLRGIGLFQLEILHLISIGKVETVEEIEKHFSNADIVEYLTRKYSTELIIDFAELYNIDAINHFFQNYGDYIVGNEYRKYGIAGDESGLLLIPALIVEKINTCCHEWLPE